MAGQPVRHKMEADIAALGGPDAILERMASGETIKRIADSLGVSRPFLSGWMHKQVGAEAMEAARRQGADALADETLDIADNATEDRISKLKITTRQWTAAHAYPERYADRQGPVVEINVGDLHLNALRRVESEVKQGFGQTVTLPARPRAASLPEPKPALSAPDVVKAESIPASGVSPAES